MVTRVLLMLSAAVLLSGCASMGAMQRADTLAPGRHEFGVETALQSVVGREVDGRTALHWPYLGMRYRRGLTDRLEGSLGASFVALEAGAKLRVNEPSDRNFAVSVAGLVGGSRSPGSEENRTAIFHTSLAVLLGWRVGESAQLVLGPRAQYIASYPTRVSGAPRMDLFGAGTSVGFLVPIGTWFAVMPEFSVMTPFGRDQFRVVERMSPVVGGLNGLLFQTSLGVFFGDVTPAVAPVEPAPGSEG